MKSSRPPFEEGWLNHYGFKNGLRQITLIAFVNQENAVEDNVRRLMRMGAITCSESASIRAVAQIMAVNSTHYCVVTNQSHEVLGIISARSILRAFSRNLDETTAQDILLPHTFTITPNSTLAEAICLMDKRKIEHLIVTSDRDGSRAVVGLLHVEDIIAKMAQED